MLELFSKPKKVHWMTLQAPSSAAECWVGARAWRNAVGAGWLPRHRLGRRLPHHRQGPPLLRQDHLVHRPLPLLCHVHPAWTRPHIARSLSKPNPRPDQTWAINFQEPSTDSGTMFTLTGPSWWTVRLGSTVQLRSFSPTALGWVPSLPLEATTSSTMTASGSIKLSSIFFHQYFCQFSFPA